MKQSHPRFFYGDLLVLHCTSLTAHNKMASKRIESNIIKMKLTEEKRYYNFLLWFFLAEMRLNVGNVHNVSSTRVAEFDLLMDLVENLAEWMLNLYLLTLIFI